MERDYASPDEAITRTQRTAVHHAVRPARRSAIDRLVASGAAAEGLRQ